MRSRHIAMASSKRLSLPVLRAARAMYSSGGVVVTLDDLRRVA